MSYRSIVEMASSQSLIARIAACAAQEGVETNPLTWAQDNIWKVAASPGWADQWSYAVDTATVNVNPDTGARNDVITDGNILSVVQPMIIGTP